MNVFLKSALQFSILIFIVVNCQQNFSQISSEVDNFLDLLFSQIYAHQVIIMSQNDDKNKYHPIEDLIFRNIIVRYPTENMDYQDVVMKHTDKTNGQIKYIILDRATILFVNILETDKFTDKTEQEFLETLRVLSSDTYIAKFLLFILNDKLSKTLEYFLKLAWKVELIDVVIYEISFISNEKWKRSDNATINSVDLKKTKYSWNIFYHSTFFSRIHILNPFSGDYLHVPYNNNIVIFPNKLRNLHQYRLRIGVVDYPPYADVKTTDDGILEYTGPGGEIILSLITTMNFTMIPEIGTLSQYGVLLSNGSATGLLAKVRDNKLDLIAFGAFVFYSTFGDSLDRTAYVSLEETCAAVPLIPLSSFYVKDSVWVIGSIMILLIFTIWIFSLFLRSSDSLLWHPLNIVLVILGMTIPQQPKKLRERFIFGSIGVVSILYSSSIFAQMTSINLDSTTFKGFVNMKEVDESGLIPVLHPNMYNITFRFGGNILQRLGKKSVMRSDYSEICPMWLWQFKNVTCILGNYMYSFLKKVYKAQPKEKGMKIVTPCLWAASRAYILRKSSPYTQRFSQIIMRITETGLLKHATFGYIFNYSRDQNVSLWADEGSQDPFVIDMQNSKTVYLVLFGAFVSTCVFVGEIFTFQLQKRIKKKMVVFPAKSPYYSKNNI